MKVDLASFSPKNITSTYDKTAFSMMGYILSDDGWVKRAKIEVCWSSHWTTRVSVDCLSKFQEIQQYLDGVKLTLIEMKERVDKIREVTKETGTYVAKLRM